MPTRRKITLLALLLAALFASWPPTIAAATASANPAEISKTASGDFSAPTHLASAIFTCNSRQALGKTPSATTEGVCAFSYGKEADQLSALNYYGYRYYDPLSLTWTQADPLFRFNPDLAYDQPRLASLYTFSLNNPVRYMDPDGRVPLAIPAACAATGACEVVAAAAATAAVVVAAKVADALSDIGLPDFSNPWASPETTTLEGTPDFGPTPTSIDIRPNEAPIAQPLAPPAASESRGRSRQKGERRQQRKNPNPQGKPKSQDNQTGQRTNQKPKSNKQRKKEIKRRRQERRQPKPDPTPSPPSDPSTPTPPPAPPCTPGTPPCTPSPGPGTPTSTP